MPDSREKRANTPSERAVKLARTDDVARAETASEAERVTVKIARLKALRLAKDARDAQARAAAPAATVKKRASRRKRTGD